MITSLIAITVDSPQPEPLAMTIEAQEQLPVLFMRVQSDDTQPAVSVVVKSSVQPCPFNLSVE